VSAPEEPEPDVAVRADADGSGGRPGGEGPSDGEGRSESDPRAATRRDAVLGGAVVAILGVNAVLLAWTEMAWLTLRAGNSDVPLPLAALVALVTTPVLALAAEAARPGGRAPLVPLALWTVTVVVAGLWSPAGAGVLPPDWRAILLLAAGVLPGAVVLSRTSARRRAGGTPTPPS